MSDLIYLGGAVIGSYLIQRVGSSAACRYIYDRQSRAVRAHLSAGQDDSLGKLSGSRNTSYLRMANLPTRLELNLDHTGRMEVVRKMD